MSSPANTTTKRKPKPFSVQMTKEDATAVAYYLHQHQGVLEGIGSVAKADAVGRLRNIFIEASKS